MHKKLTDYPWFHSVAHLHAEMGVALVAAHEGSKIVRDGYHAVHAVEQKGAGEVFTQVDRLADATVTKVIHSAQPHHAIISEELAPDGNDGDTTWIVDPLDGTKLYIDPDKKHPELVSTMIAFRERIGDVLETTLAVMWFPLTMRDGAYEDDVYVAARGKGAFKNGKRLRPPADPSTLSHVVVFNPFSDARYATDTFTRMHGRMVGRGYDEVSFGAQSGIAARMMSGDRTIKAVLHDNRPAAESGGTVKQGPWDIAAVQLMVEEAGGAMVNERGERVHPFRQETMLIARTRAIADEILALAK